MIQNPMSSLQKKFYIFSCFIIIFGILFSIIYKKFHIYISLFPYPCATVKFLHVYCPSCGGTRALNALINLSFFKSFMYNPIVLYVFLMFLYYYIKTTLSILFSKKFKPCSFNVMVVYIGLVIIFSNCFLKNFLAIFFNIDYLGNIHTFWHK